MTGASRGLGLEFCRHILSRSHGSLVACARSESKELRHLVREHQPTNRITFLKLDLTDQESIEEATKHIDHTYGRVDVLLNVAGAFALFLVLARGVAYISGLYHSAALRHQGCLEMADKPPLDPNEVFNLSSVSGLSSLCRSA